MNRQIERDNLDELIAVAEADQGPITVAEIDEKREVLLQARREQGTADPHIP